jgi:thiol-disulfide isomerase/thioredoxin
MTIASLLLAVLATTYTPPSDATAEPVLLDFHAEWCGPCQKMRRAVEQLNRQGYPIKSIDIDQSPELAARYRVQSVPTFIVVDGSGRALDRTSVLQSAASLARFYRTAALKAQPPANSNGHVGSRERSRDRDGDDSDSGSDSDDPPPRVIRAQNAADSSDDDDERSEPQSTNPNPWETVVRIKVMNAHSIGFGSGTIIHSTPKESLIITCAHIFKLEGLRQQAPPSKFPRPIKIDLFDGKLRGTSPAQVHYVETVDGEAVDYDFVRDVGLIRIHPGRRLPCCRVVPAHWEPKSRMRMLTVGCSEGRDATAWHTSIVRPRMTGFLSGNSAYEAVECMVAPKQGRSGGGLFTEDGYIAGVCNFAEPMGDHGLYATPRSMYSILDRNNLSPLYAPVTRGSGTLLADRRSRGQSRQSEPVSVARSQSPDQEEPDRERPRRRGSDGGDVMIPPPSLLGIADPSSRDANESPRAASTTTRRTAWHPTPIGPDETGRKSFDRTEPTHLKLDPAADNDRFATIPEKSHDHERDAHVGDAEPATGLSSEGSVAPPRSRWRLVTVPSAEPDQGPSER